MMLSLRRTLVLVKHCSTHFQIFKLFRRAKLAVIAEATNDEMSETKNRPKTVNYLFEISCFWKNISGISKFAAVFAVCKINDQPDDHPNKRT
jgi:hypothetical protein